ncbi:MAG: NAD-dependent epimerase/dehydratase family protein [Syntrophaceae bacterium]|nr:NAD-dependent epimerase/dehydratase family protein [Syntrophaceae bacterium]
MAKKRSFKVPSLKGLRVLVTGGLGFIGSNLTRRCLELGARVTVFDCLDPRSGGNLFNVRDIKDDIDLYFYDILTFENVCQHIINKDIVFNCAASTSHPFSMREPWIDLDVNSRGVINLLEAIRRFNPDVKFIHLGTSTQLGRLHYQPADENHPEFPADIYSANKSVSEKFVLIYATAYQMRASVIRLSNVFGPRASIHSSDFTFNNYFVGLALQGKEVTVFGDGSQKRNVIFVDDAVSALILASRSDAVDGQTWFVVGDEHYSVADIARATVEHIGSGRVRFVEWPKGKKAIDVGDAILSNQRFKSIIPWAAQDTLGSGLIKTREYYRDCLAAYLR